MWPHKLVVSVFLLASCGFVNLAYAKETTDDADGREVVSPAITKPILDSGLPLRELRAYVAARIPPFVPPHSKSNWQSQAKDIRRDLMEKVYFRGEAANWRDSKSHVEWLDTIPGDSDYVIRKFRYEALPGMWFPALLYEPTRLGDKAPVFINLNGHDELGKATPEKQRRCINLAKRGMLAFSFEFLYMNQLRDRGNRHNALVQLDLCGTSGVAPFVLALTRGLDAALAHPHAYATRVGIAGLSGGGWQTIVLASLDERITLANPVAGYTSMLNRTQFSRDVGDCEQFPTDLCTVADYTHLTALVAPRPLLLTYNAQDNCCFLPDSTLPLLENAARPIYALQGADNHFRTHINREPGTHNFQRDNREALYRLVRDFFYSGNNEWNASDIPIDETELKTSDQLLVPLPPNNATLHSLALQLSDSLPRGMDIPTKKEDSAVWQTSARQRLREIVHLPHYEARALAVEETKSEQFSATRWKVSLDDSWTTPAVEFAPAKARGITILFGDGGRTALQSAVKERLASNECVLAVDPLAFGEAYQGVDATELQMIATVGERPLGIQAAQIAAMANWMERRHPNLSLKLIAVGPRKRGRACDGGG